MELMLISSKELEFGDELGNGGEGSVFKGKWRLVKNGMEELREVAIKQLLKSTDLSELKTLSGLNHPNIINVFGFVEEHRETCIVMELCQYSLRGFFERNPSPLSDEHLLRWSLEAALPLEYLRKHKILHRDVKPENYVVDSGMVLKLTDFGVARDLDCTVSKFTQVGTWRWMAPEVHNMKDNRLLLSPLYDIFALGLVLWYLVARKIPYSESDNNFVIAQAIIAGERPVIPTECPMKLAELIKKCWSGDRKDRPDISQVILLIKDVIVSLETTGTLLRIEDMTSVETTGTLPHLMEASEPPITQAISSSQADVITKTEPKSSVETTGTLPHLMEASGPPITQAISSSQVDVITKTEPKSYHYSWRIEDDEDHFSDRSYSSQNEDDEVIRYLDSYDDRDDYYADHTTPEDYGDDYQDYTQNDDDYNDEHDWGRPIDDEDFEDSTRNDYDDYYNDDCRENSEYNDFENYADGNDYDNNYDDDDYGNYDNEADDYHNGNYPSDGYSNHGNDSYEDYDEIENEKESENEQLLAQRNRIILLEEQIKQVLQAQKNAQQVSKPIHIDSHAEEGTSATGTSHVLQPSSGPSSPGEEEGDVTLQVFAADKPQTRDMSGKCKEQNKKKGRKACSVRCCVIY